MDVETDALLDRYAAAPEALRQAIAALEPAALDRAPAGEWTPRQIALHLADSEAVAAVRFRLLLAQDNPTFPVYEQAAWAERLGYAGADAAALSQAVELFAQLRAATARLLRQAPAVRWEAVGLHPERGPMSLRAVLALYAGHGEGHLAQLRRVVAEG